MSAPSIVVAHPRSVRRQGVDIAGLLFAGALLLALLLSLAILAVLVGTQLAKGLPVFAERGTTFLTSDLSSNPAKAGVAQGLVGTALLVVIVALCAFPIGIMTAIYLEEYSADNRFARFIDINIRNLAGVPSVVYGILGLTVFVGLFAALGDGNGKTVITGGLTLAVLILPLVIITSAEAIRAVPSTLREAGFGLGASRWQVVRKLILPSAAPGILTGTVLALSRAIGETAPLILVGAVLGSFSTAGQLGDLATGPYTGLPAIIYDWAKRPQHEFQALTSAAIIVLLAVTVIANAAAVVLRNRYSRRW
ncbi:MAG: phosphate ABC transporter permease PstA [Chloroflexota bacterium]